MTATVHTLNARTEPSLGPMIALVAADMNGVNSAILERMQSKVALIPELAGHLIAGGGKRMRPQSAHVCIRSSPARQPSQKPAVVASTSGNG